MKRFLLILAACFSLVAPVFAAPPPAAEFGTLPAIYDVAISPNGEQIAAIRVVEGRYVVQVVDITKTDEELRLVGLGEGVKPINIVWANDDRLLVSLWQSEKIRTTPITVGYLYTLDARTMKGRILVKPPLGVFRQYNNKVVDYLRDDPDHILMSFSNDDNNDLVPDIRKVDVATGRSTIVRRGVMNIQNWYTDLRGEPRVGQGLRDKSTEEWVLRIREADGDKWYRETDFPTLPPDSPIYGFTSDPNELIIGAYEGRDTRGLYVYHLIEKQITREIFHHDEYDAGGVVLSGDGTEVVGATYVADTREIELTDGYASGLERLRAKFPHHTVDYIDQSIEAGLMIARISSPSDPGGVFVYDTATDGLSSMGSLYPNLRSEQLGQVVKAQYTARDGVKIPAYVTVPPTITETDMLKDVPFIILPHGGPYARDVKRFDVLAQFFASRGYGVLQMNFRGSRGYGKTFEDSGRENWVVMQEDVEDGARWLINAGYADPNRICIAGWSYGGYAALMGALKSPDLYSCAISMAGVTDLQDMVSDIKKYRFGQIRAENFVLRGFDSKADMKANSPVRLAEQLEVPLLLAHGEADLRVHYDHFRRMKSALRKSDADVAYLSFDDEDHFLSNQENRIAFYEAMDAFLEDYLGASNFVN